MYGGRLKSLECVDEAEIGILGDLSGDRRIGRLDIQTADVVGEDRNLVGMRLMALFQNRRQFTLFDVKSRLL